MFEIAGVIDSPDAVEALARSGLELLEELAITIEQRLDCGNIYGATVAAQSLASAHHQFVSGSVDAGSPAGTLANPWLVKHSFSTPISWQNFYINGVRWRGKEIPELPLIQPEKEIGRAHV